MVGGCDGTQFGCCGNEVTGREDEAGTNCSPEPIEPCAVVDRAACDGEDVTVKGVSDACFAAGVQIAGNVAACGTCDPAIEGPADVCVECQQAVFGAFGKCDEHDVDIEEVCSDEYASCAAVEVCKTFAEKQDGDGNDETGRMPSDAEVAAVGPEAVALLKCYMDALFTPELLAEMVEDFGEFVSGCAAETLTASVAAKVADVVDAASDATVAGVNNAVQCGLDCAAAHDTVAIAKCAGAAGTDMAAIAACSADLTACTTGCATGRRARRDDHQGTGGEGGDGNGGGKGDGNGGGGDGMSPCTALAQFLNKIPSLCNRQRRDAHTAAICAVMETAKTGLKAAADAGVEGDFTITSDVFADGSSTMPLAVGGATLAATVVALLM
jgi:hypothetical protein